MSTPKIQILGFNSYSKAESDKKFEAISGKVSSNTKRITNLEERLSDDVFVTDDSVAYVKSVPSGALPYAEITKFGGMSYKTKNLIPYPYYENSQTHNGITYTINNDGTITVNGTATNTSFLVLALGIYLPAGEYTINSDTNLGFSAHMRWGNDVYDKTFTSTGEARDCEIRIDSGTTLNNVTFKPMLNKGSTALPYEPYFEGLRHAKPTAFKSVGANMLGGRAWANTMVDKLGGVIDNESTVHINSWEVSDKTFYDEFKPNTQYTIMFAYSNTYADSYTPSNLIIQYTDGSAENLASSNTTPNEKNTVCFVSAQGKSIERICGSYQADTSTFWYNECGIFEGVISADEYVPYKESTLAIPTAVQNIDGYGYGVNANAYNYIEWLDGIKKYHRACGAVDLGTLEWTLGDMFYATVSNKKQGISNILCAKYQNAGTPFAHMQDKSVTGNEVYPLIYIKDSAYSDAATFKAAMSGIMLVYELATPTVGDISDKLPDDNFIAVEGGGTITAENDYGYDVPSEIEYQKEIAE